jgi:bifunctional NMN adenylyltransferase/nudix hydrolase
MMKPEVDRTDVGVIVGRFQVPHLHEAHTELIQTVCSNHPKVIIILGLSPCKVTYNNPLDFEARKQMLLEKFPNVVVAYVKDCVSDEVWSRKLDETISDLVSPNQTVTLYGSRDSFIPHYKGRFKTQRLEQRVYVSGSELRREISAKVKASSDFRAGVIWATANQYAKVHPTVDVAILNERADWVLMARKPNETNFRFVGGFATTGGTYEQDARREVMEETHCDITDPEYIGSCLIDDWRYRKESDKIKTLFFKAKYVSGSPKADDDVAELRWWAFSELKEKDVVPEHRPLLRMLYQNLNISAEKETEGLVTDLKVAKRALTHSELADLRDRGDESLHAKQNA